MKNKLPYVIVSIISIGICRLLIYRINLGFNEPITLAYTKITIPYWLLIILNMILFPIISCLLLNNIEKK